MRKLFILTLILATLVIFAGFKIYPGEDQKCDCQFVEESLKNISKIKIGMKRKALLESFREEGGISTRTQKHYVYKNCRYIKIEVKFSPVGNESNKFDESDDDKIIEVSKSYLEYAATD